MKKLAVLILLLSAWVIFNPQAISANPNQYPMDDLNLIDYFWSGNEEDLYLNINLSKELKFDSGYYKKKIKGGESCEISCYPLEDAYVASSLGYLLQKITFLVEVSNSDNLNHLKYKIVLKSSYVGTSEEGNRVTTTTQSTREGSIRNPAIDLNEEPVFFTINDELNKGVISFKNSFPYSSMH